MPATLDSLINATEPTRLATGFGFTEGPLYHPDGFFYFVDLRVEPTLLYRIVPGGQPEVVWSGTEGANGTTFDMQGRLLLCQGGARLVVRRSDNGDIKVLADGIEGASDAPPTPTPNTQFALRQLQLNHRLAVPTQPRNTPARD